MAQNLLTMTFLFGSPYDIIIWAGQDFSGILGLFPTTTLQN
jgi:hypothetical protein